MALLVIAACAVAVAGPFLKRNHDLFGTFAGPVSDTTINSKQSLREGVGNVIRSVAVSFRVGGGRLGPDTAVQHIVLGGLEDLYEFVGASADDQRYVIGGTSDAFERGDYRTWARLEEYGANPWHVVLILGAGFVLVVGAARGDRSLRLPALLAVGLTVGFVAFSATTRWSLYVTRYQLPLYAAWAPLIAIALGRLHRPVLVSVVGVLVLAVTPQLFDNAARSLVHRQPNLQSELAPYFFFGDDSDVFVGPSDYVAARNAIVQSGCDRLGIANWVLLEYPIWVGLDNAGWRGEIAHVNVSNPSATLQDDDFRPCALIRQTLGQSPIASPRGWFDVPFGDLTVAFPPEFLRRQASG